MVTVLDRRTAEPLFEGEVSKVSDHILPGTYAGYVTTEGSSEPVDVVVTNSAAFVRYGDEGA